MTTYVIYEGKAYTTERLFRKLGTVPSDLQTFTFDDDESAVLMRFLEGHWIRVTPRVCLRYVELNHGYIVKAKGKEFIYINC